MTSSRSDRPFPAGPRPERRWISATAAAQSGPSAPPRAAAGILALPAARARVVYQLIIGAYLYDEPYPEPLAGHSFIAIQDPDGKRLAFGFSPANFGSYDPHRDLVQLTNGVEGIVHDDESAFTRPGVKTRAFAIDETQALAAMAKIHEYQSCKYRFSLALRQCSTFALDVLHAARIRDLGEPRVRPPREIYRNL